jgi:flagellar protein FlaF
MAAASLVASALGIVLILVTAYVLVGGTVMTSETVVNAQKDMTALQVKMIGTSMDITDVSTSNPRYITIENTGSEAIRDFEQIDVFLTFSGSAPTIYRYNAGGGIGFWKKNDITPDFIHPQQWDPGEVLNMSVEYPVEAGTLVSVQVITGNGASAATVV